MSKNTTTVLVSDPRAMFDALLNYVRQLAAGANDIERAELSDIAKLLREADDRLGDHVRGAGIPPRHRTTGGAL